MNNQRIHDAIIARAKSRERPNCYCEAHHIIPRSMGGSDSPDNIAILTAREHYVVHWLLFRIHRTPAMCFAWHQMTYGRKDVSRYTSHTFKYAREAHVRQISGEGSPFYGKTMGADHRGKLSVAKLGRTYEEMGRLDSPLKGRTLTEGHKSKVRIASIGRSHSVETRALLSESKLGEKNPNYGKETPEDVRKKISRAMSGREMPHKRRAGATNTSGIAGARYDKRRGKWVATISINWNNIVLGEFDEREDAVAIRRYFEALIEPPNDAKNYSRDDLLAIRDHYRAKARELRRETET